MQTFRALIDLWPTLPDFAADIDVTYVTAQAMHRRDGISSEYWPAMVEAAERRRIVGVSLEILASISAARRKSKRPSLESDQLAESASESQAA